MKIDPYKNKETYENWKKNGAKIPEVSKRSERVIRDFILDLEHGNNVNTSNKRGGRSYIRLNSYRHKLKLLATLIESNYNRKNIVIGTKENWNEIFNKMHKGDIKRKDGKPYIQTSDYVKTLKCFWHWFMKVSPNTLEDITLELDSSRDKPKWVYLNETDFKKYANSANLDYKTICFFILDSGTRATEFKNTRVSSFSDDFKTFTITDEVSKTIGRKMKLMISSDLIKEYVERHNLKGDDLLFPATTSRINQYLKRLGKRVFGDRKTDAGKLTSEITLTDLRHISATYWLPRYPKQSGMMYRFSWKKADKVFYYSEFLGLVDNITEEDMLIDVTKSDLMQKNDKLEKDLEIYKESSDFEIEKLKKIVKEDIHFFKQQFKLNEQRREMEDKFQKEETKVTKQLIKEVNEFKKQLDSISFLTNS